MKTIQQFFKRKETYLGIGAALLFQLIFFTVWLTGYEGVDERTDQWQVAVVNEDKDFDMVLHIPTDFTSSVKEGSSSAQLEYYINQATPSLTKQTMQSVANDLTKQSINMSINKTMNNWIPYCLSR